MSRLSRWLRAPRSLSVLLAIVVLVPATALVVLGVRLLEQDRALARQRRLDVLQHAADQTVHALQQRVNEVVRQLSDRSREPGPPPDGTAWVTIGPSGVQVNPSSAIAWYPVVARLPEPPDGPFAAADRAEVGSNDAPAAFELCRRVENHQDAATRAGALLREARLLRKMGRAAEARTACTSLAAIRGVAIAGEPVELFARRFQCSIAQEQHQDADLLGTAGDIALRLESGVWQLDETTYEYVCARLDEWLGPARRARARGGREAVAQAVAWLWQQTPGGGGQAATVTASVDTSVVRTDARPNGSRTISTASGLATVIWTASAGELSAWVAPPSHVERQWMPAAVVAARPAVVSLVPDSDTRPAPGADSAEGGRITLRSSETGLPWTIAATLPVATDPVDLTARRRVVLAALAAVLLLVAAATWLVVRLRGQEVQLSRLQSEFVAAVSHEFRTPLTALRQFNELLGDEEQLPHDKRRAYHAAQVRATERLRRLVESLLDFARMEAGRRPYIFERVDACAFVRDVVEEFRVELDGTAFEISCQVEEAAAPILADTEALGRAVWNLLDNAVKYSGDRKAIEVSVAVVSLPGGDTEIRIAVRDQGIGIPVREQPGIFEKFVRGAAATSARIKGTGIGLATVRHVVTAHRGRLRLESAPGQGSTFTIELPAAGERSS